MLDGKILAAVLATLTAFAVSTTGGSVEGTQIETDTGEMMSSGPLDTARGLATNPVNQLRKMLTTTPEPANSVEATLRADNLWEESITVKGADLSAANMTTIDYGASIVKSNEEITAYSFSGSIEPSNTTVIEGTSSGIMTSGVNVSMASRLEENIETSNITIKGTKKSSIDLSEVSGSISSSNASTEFESSRTLSIDSFTGDITVYPGNKTLILNGRVNQLSAGSFQFGN